MTERTPTQKLVPTRGQPSGAQAPAALSTCTWRLAPSSDTQPWLRARRRPSRPSAPPSPARWPRGLGGGPQRGGVEDGGVGVLQPAEPGALEHLGGLLVGHLAQGQVQPAEVVDVDDPRLAGARRRRPITSTITASSFSPALMADKRLRRARGNG